MANPPVLTGAQAQLINSEYPYTTEVDAGDDKLNHRVELHGAGLAEAVDPASQSLRTTETNPLDTHYQFDVQAEVTDGADGTYDYYVNMATFRKMGIQLELSGGSGTVTVKIYGSLEETDGDPSLLTYQDIGAAVFSAASWTASAMLLDAVEALSMISYVHIEVVASTGGANDADWSIYTSRLY
jgi:hypothetical protein